MENNNKDISAKLNEFDKDISSKLDEFDKDISNKLDEFEQQPNEYTDIENESKRNKKRWNCWNLSVYMAERGGFEPIATVISSYQ